MKIERIKLSKEEFVERVMEEMRDKKLREYEAKMAYHDYVHDRVNRYRKKSRRRK